ncbi:ABC transporter ATP-binding protein [Paenibacillus glucanolyticus]|uniref:ABC transporter ATP-binding protein n=1 Tax=Paenibacillus glucanolyticus TaxID=59843 RepID=A0A163HY29_9BACL|nr:ABC transporter ATP-binding protein [Paenibacillus glucanolyticus]KZS45706.1 ABC transporter ATP-binding protein [Paenibacillus glucanolyticus]
MIDHNEYRQAIEQMYEYRATISRHVYVKDPKTKEEKQVLEEVYLNQPCKLSQTGLAKNGQGEDANILQYDAKLFIAPELEIKQGDLISVTRVATGRATVYSAGEPFPPYQSHQEINLTAKDWA